MDTNRSGQRWKLVSGSDHGSRKMTPFHLCAGDERFVGEMDETVSTATPRRVSHWRRRWRRKRKDNDRRRYWHVRMSVGRSSSSSIRHLRVHHARRRSSVLAIRRWTPRRKLSITSQQTRQHHSAGRRRAAPNRQPTEYDSIHYDATRTDL